LLDAAPEYEQEIEKLDAEIKRLRSERNDIMHWIWGESEGSDAAFHISARPFRKHQMSTKTADQIKKIAHETVEAIEALLWWQNYIHGSRRVQ